MNWSVILAIGCGIAVTQSLFLGTVLFRSGYKGSKTNLYWGLLCIALALRIGKSLVYYFWLDMSLWGVALGGAGLWAIGPALLAFQQSQGKSERRTKHFLHFIPSILILFSGAIWDWPQMTILYGLGNLHLAIYLVFAFLAYRKNGHIKPKAVRVVFVSTALILGAFVFQFYMGTIQLYAIGGVMAAMALYGMNYVVSIDIQKTKGSKSNRDSSIKRDTLEHVSTAINQLFSTEAIYKQPKLTLSKVAERIDQPVYIVRQAIIQIEGKNFNDFVNAFRITDATALITADQSKYTIEGIANDVGFNSVSSFYEAFKKQNRCTPLAYKKKHTENQKTILFN